MQTTSELPSYVKETAVAHDNRSILEEAAVIHDNRNILYDTESTVKIKDTTANPAPLGLLAFGMTTILLNLHNAGLFAMGSMILAMGIFYGGLAQIVAGIMEWKKNNTFGATAFLSYGFFWLTLVGLLLMPSLGLGVAQESTGIVAYLFIWGLFTSVMFIATLKHNRALQFVFSSLAVLFFLLAIGDATGSALIKTIAGYVGIICGLAAMYTGLSQVLNETFGRTICPVDFTFKKSGQH